MILDEIVAHKREEVRDRRGKIPIGRVAIQADNAPPTVSLGASLAKGGGIRVIAECKKASPSKGVIRQDYRPTDIARSYKDNGAAGISVLTDGRFFQGRLDDLYDVRQAVALPVLRKEFVIDEYQILEARAAGADAVLLICAILDSAQLRDYVELIRELGMDALVEIYDLDEIDMAVEWNTGIVGVNNRDLRTFEVDLGHTAEVAKRIPKDLLLVSESGIAKPDDVAFVRSVGAKAILVGEAFMSAANPGKALAELMGKEEAS